MLDITASHETRDTTYKTVENIASQVFIPLTVGGGVRNIEDIKKLLRSGGDKVSINTSAVENPDFVKKPQINLDLNVLSLSRCQIKGRFFIILGSSNLRW